MSRPSPPRDLAIRVPHRPGALATMGEALGAAGVSILGGGAFAHDGVGVAHFLIHADDEPAARAALAAAGLEVIACREVVQTRLDQDRPGQLGAFCRALAGAGVSIEVLYSDHDHQLCVVVDDPVRARAIADAPVRR